MAIDSNVSHLNATYAELEKGNTPMAIYASVKAKDDSANDYIIGATGALVMDEPFVIAAMEDDSLPNFTAGSVNTFSGNTVLGIGPDGVALRKTGTAPSIKNVGAGGLVSTNTITSTYPDITAGGGDRAGLCFDLTSAGYRWLDVSATPPVWKTVPNTANDLGGYDTYYSGLDDNIYVASSAGITVFNKLTGARNNISIGSAFGASEVRLGTKVDAKQQLYIAGNNLAGNAFVFRKFNTTTNQFEPICPDLPKALVNPTNGMVGQADIAVTAEGNMTISVGFSVGAMQKTMLYECNNNTTWIKKTEFDVIYGDYEANQG